jgi:hypothetical protein
MMEILRSTAILALPILAYLLGWTYLDAYYDTFEIPLSNLDLPIEHYFTVGALSVLRGAGSLNHEQIGWNHLWYALIAFSSIAALLASAAPIAALQRWRPFIMGASFAIVAGSGFVLARELALENATLQPPEVRVQLIPEADAGGGEDDRNLAQINDTGYLRLIYWDENTIVVGSIICPASEHVAAFRARREQAALADRQTVGIEPTAAELVGFIEDLTSHRSQWSVWLLPARRVGAVSFEKAAASNDAELERDAFLSCSRQLDEARARGAGKDEDKPAAPSSDSAVHSPRPPPGPAPEPAPPPPPSQPDAPPLQ